MGNVPDRVAVGEGVSVPVEDVLTGRGFITGKSGSGKSNTVGVLAEELLTAGCPLVVVDTDGEYYALKELFEVAHLGGDATCDRVVGTEHAESIATLALDGVPVVLDTSGYETEAEAQEVVAAVADALFRAEKRKRTPLLCVVEEIHEWLPQQGGLNEAGEALVRIAKRGRKRGLGLIGLSQRPAAVSKEYVTQCDWLVWHRLTWANDTRVARQILGDEYAERVSDLDPGEAFLQADWEDTIRQVRFRRKRTFDAGATPGLDAIDEEPPVFDADGDLLAALDAPAPEDCANDLRAELQAKEERIAELEAELERVRVENREWTHDDTDAASQERANDPVWEVGQFVAYLLRAISRSCLRIAWAPVRGWRRLTATGRKQDTEDGERVA